MRTLVLPEVARRLADVGVASLRFDYSGFGDSQGERGWIDPGARADDARFALEALIAQPHVDAVRLGVYGHSLGGPVALATAAADVTGTRRMTMSCSTSCDRRNTSPLRCPVQCPAGTASITASGTGPSTGGPWMSAALA